MTSVWCVRAGFGTFAEFRDRPGLKLGLMQT